MPVPPKKDKSSLETSLISGLEQHRYKMILEYLHVPESKTVLKNWWEHVQRTQEPIQGDPTSQIWDNVSFKIIKDSNEL